MKPFPLISAEKLETQNGIRNNRRVCHLSLIATAEIWPPMLRTNATPMKALIPTEFNQMLGEGSK